MTEDQAERRAEKIMDQLDKSLLSGAMTQEEYDREVAQLDKDVREWIKGGP